MSSQPTGVNGDAVVNSYPTHGADDVPDEPKGLCLAPASVGVDPRIDVVASAIAMHPDAPLGVVITDAQIIAALDALDRL